ncbi:MAG TPA: class I SAM-dependent methyltransferase [Allosphingosinicella sp.]|jgi:SAM-dependent methyltransferase
MAPHLSRRDVLAGAGALGMLPCGAGAAAAREVEYDPPFVPTPHLLVQKMLDLAGVGASDYLIDLGCGDGRIPVAAGRRGARALGVDLDPMRIQEAFAAARIAEVEARVNFRIENLFRTPIYEASVIAIYLLPRVNLALRPRLLTELRPGSRIVSHAFDMGDWRPDGEDMLDRRRIFLWLVPGVAGGEWTMTDAAGASFDLAFEQRFQDVTGTMTGGGRVREVRDATLRGTRFAFTVDGDSGPLVYRGTVGEAAITAEPGAANDGWRAVRRG